MNCGAFFAAEAYDLGATLESGQAFRWARWESGWEGVIGGRWVALTPQAGGIVARTAEPPPDWNWLKCYLQTETRLADVLAQFPDDAPIRASVAACRGLRLLRQEPWECLASFLLSSTKQIVQIRQIIDLLCRRFGEPVAVPLGHAPAWSFPEPGRLAGVSESDLRACKMGFRARALREAAQRVAKGDFNLNALPAMTCEDARDQLMQLPGVGPKIADCVLLFACGFETAFPIDVWIAKALRQLYFPRRRRTERQLREFAAGHFGPRSGYAQQYLFHYMRTRAKLPSVRRTR